MRLHSAMGLFLGHKTLTERSSTNWVRVNLGTSLYWVRVDWHPMKRFVVCIAAYIVIRWRRQGRRRFSAELSPNYETKYARLLFTTGFRLTKRNWTKLFTAHRRRPQPSADIRTSSYSFGLNIGTAECLSLWWQSNLHLYNNCYNYHWQY